MLQVDCSGNADANYAFFAAAPPVIAAVFLAPRSFLARFLRSFICFRDFCTASASPFCENKHPVASAIGQHVSAPHKPQQDLTPLTIRIRHDAQYNM